jgi:hypothetical protein
VIARSGRLALVGLCIAGVSLGRTAHAQDAAAAEALFKQGRELMARGEYATACPKLAESERLDPSSGTALNLALCHQKQGKLANAWADYKAAARIAQQQRRPDREAEANREAAEVERSLAYLTVDVAEATPNLEVDRDGVRLDVGSIGAKLPVDPGEHVVTAKAAGYKPLTRKIMLSGPGAVDVVELPALEKEDAVAPVAPVAAPVAAPIAAASPEAAQRGAGALPWILGGVGVAAIGVGAAFGAVALGTYDDAVTACPMRTGCSSDALDKKSSANTQANVANVAIGVGAAAVAAGVIVYLVRRPSSSDARASARRWVPAPRAAQRLEVTF